MTYIPFDKIWQKVKNKFAIEGALNVKYDSDLDGIIDNADMVDSEHASAFEHVANKGQPNGYCPLDANALVPLDNVPIIPRTKLEYVTDNVTFAYLATINKLKPTTCLGGNRPAATWILTLDAFADKAIWSDLKGYLDSFFLMRFVDCQNWYECPQIVASATTNDHRIRKVVNGTFTTIASEAVDIPVRALVFAQVSGSNLASDRNDDGVFELNVTDTSLQSGYFGMGSAHMNYNDLAPVQYNARLMNPRSKANKAILIAECDIIGDGSVDNPFEPKLTKDLRDIPSSLKELYVEKRKYDMLRAKGFSDEEIKLLLGYIPQHKIDVASVTWCAFDFDPSKHNTFIITIHDVNPYSKEKAIDAQKQTIRILAKAPKDYNESNEIYKHITKDYDCLAGKDNFAYQCLGDSIFELFQIADTYYGQVIELNNVKPYKNVNDNEMRLILTFWIEALKHISVLKHETEKHIAKLNKVLKNGW